MPPKNITDDDRKQAYLDSIAQYKDTPYYQDLLANPYAYPNRAKYTPSWWEENISQNIFGDMSKENAWVAQQEQASKEYIAQVVGKNTERNLNQEGNKVAQMTAAGQNADLLGTSGVSDAPSGTMPDDTPPAAPQPEQVGEGPVGQIMHLFQSGLQEAMSIGTFLIDTNGKLLEQGSKELGFNKTAYDTLLEWIAGEAHFDPDNPEGTDDTLEKDLGLIVDKLLDPSEKLSPQILGNKYLRRAVKTLRGQIKYDPKTNKPSAAYQRARSKIIADIVENTTKSANGMSREGFSLDITKYAKTLYETFTSIETTLTKLENAARQKKANYESDYYGSTAEGQTLGAAEGQAAIAEAGAKKTSAVNERALESAIEEVNQEFDNLRQRLENEKDFFSQGLLLMLPFIRHRTIATIRNGVGASVGNILGSILK